jgi:hypothetical protein
MQLPVLAEYGHERAPTLFQRHRKRLAVEAPVQLGHPYFDRFRRVVQLAPLDLW